MIREKKFMFEIDLTYPEFLNLAKKGLSIVQNKIKKNPKYYEGILCPLRGGFYLTDFISRRISHIPVYYIYLTSYENGKIQKDIKIHFISELKSQKRYLICDDILATGNTVKKIMDIYPESKFEALVLYKHKNKIYPLPHYAIREVEANVWINFFWEKIL